MLQHEIQHVKNCVFEYVRNICLDLWSYVDICFNSIDLTCSVFFFKVGWKVSTFFPVMPHAHLITQHRPIFITCTEALHRLGYFNKPEHLHIQISSEHKTSLKRQSSCSPPGAQKAPQQSHWMTRYTASTHQGIVCVCVHPHLKMLTLICVWMCDTPPPSRFP